MPVAIPGFRYERVAVSDGVRLNTAIGGAWAAASCCCTASRKLISSGGMSPPRCPPSTP